MSRLATSLKDDNHVKFVVSTEWGKGNIDNIENEDTLIKDKIKGKVKLIYIDNLYFI